MRASGTVAGAPPAITGDTQRESTARESPRAVFPGSVTEFLNIDKPTVPVGTYLIPVITTSATVHSPAEGAAAAETTGAFSSVCPLVDPVPGLQASFRLATRGRRQVHGAGIGVAR